MLPSYCMRDAGPRFCRVRLGKSRIFSDLAEGSNLLQGSEVHTAEQPGPLDRGH